MKFQSFYSQEFLTFETQKISFYLNFHDCNYIISGILTVCVVLLHSDAGTNTPCLLPSTWKLNASVPSSMTSWSPSPTSCWTCGPGQNNPELTESHRGETTTQISHGTLLFCCDVAHRRERLPSLGHFYY